MSWLYLPESVEGYSPQSTCSDGIQCATSSKRPIQLKYSKHEFKTDCSTSRQSGTTCERSTGHPGVDAWILSLASLTVMPGSKEAQQMTATSGRNIAALLPNSGPDGVSYGVDGRNRNAALGKAVVPQVAEWIGRRIVEVSTTV